MAAKSSGETCILTPQSSLIATVQIHDQTVFFRKKQSGLGLHSLHVLPEFSAVSSHSEN